mgnify:CR=1 FL=1
MAVVTIVTLSATGLTRLARSGEGYGAGGWQIGFVGASWTGSVVLKKLTSPPGATAAYETVGYFTTDTGAAVAAGTAISAAANVIVQDVGSDLYADYTHTAGTVTITVGGASELIGSDEGFLPVLSPAFTGTMTGPAITLTGALTYGTKIVSTTALATPSALAATAFNAFASTVSGATLMGMGTTGDVTLKNRAGTTVAYVGPNTTAFTCVGAVTSTGDFTVGASTFVVTAATGGFAGAYGIVTGPQLGGLGGSKMILDFAASDTGRLFVFGPNASDNGRFSLISQRSDGTNSLTFLLFDAVGAAIFASSLTITGALTGVTTLAASSTILSSGPTGGIGYTTGAGGAQTQLTNKQTGVTSNTITTAITLNAESLAAGAITAFTLTDSAIAATDTVLVIHQSAGTSGAYTFNAFPAAGSAVISLRNNTAGALAEAIVLRVTVVKSVSA